MSDSPPLTPCQKWFAEERGRATRCALALGITKGHLSNIAAGRSRPGNELTIKLHGFAEGALSFDQILAPWMESNVGHAGDLSASPSPALPQSTADSEVAS